MTNSKRVSLTNLRPVRILLIRTVDHRHEAAAHVLSMVLQVDRLPWDLDRPMSPHATASMQYDYDVIMKMFQYHMTPLNSHLRSNLWKKNRYFNEIKHINMDQIFVCQSTEANSFKTKPKSPFWMESNEFFMSIIISSRYEALLD